MTSLITPPFSFLYAYNYRRSPSFSDLNFSVFNRFTARLHPFIDKVITMHKIIWKKSDQPLTLDLQLIGYTYFSKTFCHWVGQPKSNCMLPSFVVRSYQNWNYHTWFKVADTCFTFRIGIWISILVVGYEYTQQQDTVEYNAVTQTQYRDNLNST